MRRSRLAVVAAASFLVPGLLSPLRAAPAAPQAAEAVYSREHTLTVAGHAPLHYVATAGTLTIRDDGDRPSAAMFYVAYTVPVKAGESGRPVTFLFNGGPGSASLWLNIGAFGPVKVPATAPLPLGGAPYRIEANPETLLDRTDLVFIDAVGTGFSHALPPAKDADFWGVDEDAASFADAIERYIDRNRRWNSPRFLLGESYGTTRAAALAYILHTRNLDINGVMLLSTLLNFADDRPGSDVNAMNLLPTFAATAWYHGIRASGDADLPATLRHAEGFAWGHYAHALQMGDRLEPAEKAAVAREMSSLTGLSQAELERDDLRVDIEAYRRLLLAKRGLITGRFDTRFTGPSFAVSSHPNPATDDPATAGVTSAYYAGFRTALADQTGYDPDIPYRALHNAAVEPAWNWHHRAPATDYPLSTANTALDLTEALQASASLHVLVMTGLFDMATPYCGVKYDLAHMDVADRQKRQISLRVYPTGHMAYNDPQVLQTMTHDIHDFISGAVSGNTEPER